MSYAALASPAADAPPELEFIRKYSIPGPRYTSYPPATKFTPAFSRAQVEAAIAADNRDPAAPLSLYVHLPFCETRCWFCGCTTVITRRRDAAAEYLDDLERELRLVSLQVDRRRPVVQIHLGGGTPTFLPPEQLRRLGLMLRDAFPNVAEGAEFGVEIDPRRATEEHVAALREIGANRASLGVQDTDPRVQLAIHRLQPHRQNEQAFRWLRAAGFRSINVDLIHGLPLQTPESFACTLADVLALEPERLSIFSYAHVPWIKPAQRIFDTRNQLPSAEEKLRMAALARATLLDAGYVDIGLDHFARPDDELALAQQAGTLQRNFQGYSTRGGVSLYGFGMSSISATADAYWQNDKTLEGWRAALAQDALPVERGLALTGEDKRRRALIMRLMCDRTLDFAALSDELGVKVTETYAKELISLADLEADGLVERTPVSLHVTPRGVPILRVVAMRFDATLPPDLTRHSRTI